MQGHEEAEYPLILQNFIESIAEDCVSWSLHRRILANEVHLCVCDTVVFQLCFTI